MPTPNYDPTFSGLQPVSWRGIQFPVSSLELHLEQDHAEHKFPDRDGAHIEATGRAPLRFNAKAIFRNGCYPGPSENFTVGQLYPAQFRVFLEAAADRTTGQFIHPELGAISAKLKSAQVRWDAQSRDGVDVDCEWVESTENGFNFLSGYLAPSPKSSANAAANDLDTYKGAKTPPAFFENTFEPSFSDAMRSIQGVTDQYTLLSKQIGGQIDHVLYRANAMADSVRAAKDVTLWPVENATARAISALRDLKKSLLTSSRAVAIFQTSAPITLSALAAYLHAPIADLLSLNRDLATAATVPPFSFVRYYKQ